NLESSPPYRVSSIPVDALPGFHAISVSCALRGGRFPGGQRPLKMQSAIGAMNLDSLYSELTLETKAKLALVVLDGLGDLAIKAQGEVTPLEAAKTPNLDALVGDGCAQGRMIPVAPGITPGRGPGHLPLF